MNNRILEMGKNNSNSKIGELNNTILEMDKKMKQPIVKIIRQ